MGGFFIGQLSPIRLQSRPMAMLEYNEIRERKIILWEGEPYEVITSHVFRKQQRKPVNATKIKNLITGRVAEISFGSSEKVHEADMISRPAIFLYKAKGEVWLCDAKDKSQRFSLKEDIVGDKLKYIKDNSEVDLIIFTNDDDEEQVIGVKVPIKVELEITEAPPVIKGASANTGNKVVTLENGATINAPLFVAAGDRIRINTETGEYVERA
ncbi:MAG: efp, elongation factor elongation factor [Candidatus Nomurabacteria bacterium]|nr:efp, elongation factor elongation factor [Candidatus Nomurabacteria bacterium]